MYIPNRKQFAISELCPPNAVKRWGDGAIMLMNPLLMLSLAQIRKRHGRLRMNSSRLGFTQRGMRTWHMWTADKGTTGFMAELSRLRKYAESFSSHKRGDAMDFDPLDTTIEAVIEDIRANPDLYPFIHFVEVGVNWVHIDVRNQAGITFWHPKNGVVDFVEQKPIDWSLIAPGIDPLV